MRKWEFINVYFVAYLVYSVQYTVYTQYGIDVTGVE